MAKCLAQLAAWIGPPTALPSALPVALFVVIARGAVEATKVGPGTRSSMPSVIDLVRTPATIKMAPILTKLCSRLTLRDKC